MSVMSIEIWEWEGFGGKSWGSILQEDCKQAVQPYARQRSSSSPELCAVSKHQRLASSCPDKNPSMQPMCAQASHVFC